MPTILPDHQLFLQRFLPGATVHRCFEVQRRFSARPPPLAPAARGGPVWVGWVRTVTGLRKSWQSVIDLHTLRNVETGQ